jgi:hypothetical protein
VQPGARTPVAGPTPQPTARTPQPAEDQPAARLPTTQQAPKPRPVAHVEQRVAQPGDRICGSCGEPNDPTRKFCRRCGNSLVAAKVVEEPKLPWWKRLFGGGKKGEQTYGAGERKASMQKAAPRSRGIRGLLGRVGIVRGLLGLLVVIGIFGYVGIPSFQKVVNEVADPVMRGGPTQIVDNIRRMISPSSVKVNPVTASVRASSEVEDHPGALVIDEFSNTDWQATDKAPELSLAFEEPVDLSAMIVYAGSADHFLELRRPSQLEIVLPDGSTQAISLEDTHDPQTFDVSGNGVDRLTIRIRGTYGPEGAPVALSTIEFFKKE